MIGIIKPMLRAVLGSARVTNEELQTILCDIESMINNRPLTYVAEGDEVQPLTPDLLIRNCGLSSVPDLDEIDRNHLVCYFRNVQAVREELRNWFYKDYLALLVHTSKNRKSRDATVGEVVLIGNDQHKNRMNWQMGRILEILPGTDGHSRFARIQTQNGILDRPVQRLYPLEIK